MVRIHTVNNRRRRKFLMCDAKRASLPTLNIAGFKMLGLSKRAAVSAAAEARLVAEGWNPPHNPDGIMETAYNYSDITLPGYLVGVNQELGLISAYSFDPNAIDIRTGLGDSLRQLKARITSVTK